MFLDEQFNIIKFAILKLIYNFNALSIKIPAEFFFRISINLQKKKDSQIDKRIIKKKYRSEKGDLYIQILKHSTKP